MRATYWTAILTFLIAAFFLAPMLDGQQDQKKDPDKKDPDKKEFDKDFFKKKDFGKGGPFGGPGGGTRKLVAKFDKDNDGRLNNEERKAARESIKNDKGGFGPGKKGPPFGMKGGMEPGKAGPKVSPDDVKAYPTASLYDTSVLRTVFLEFENKDWESELADFYHTDVEVPATLIVDGKKYPNVGVHFRGASSYFGVPAGLKHSLNLSLDFIDSKQRLQGAKTLNLLNSHDDPTFMHTVLFSHIASQYIPAPKANFVKVVINGESWGVYTSAEQFNKDFLKEHFKTDKGARWKVRGSPGGGGGLDYVGENIEDYRRRYQIKSADNEKDWKALIKLCKTLSTTPADKLEEALKPMLDIDSVLWFLALDITLVNDDGYWIRASDYSLYRDAKGVFHVIPHDMNESFMAGGFGKGPKFEFKDKKEPPDKKGFEGPFGKDGPFKGPPFGKGGRGVETDPLVGLDDPYKPLRSKLLKVPSLREKYLRNVRTIATDWLDWKKLGPVVAKNRALIEKEVELDTRKLTSLDQFRRTTADTPGGGGAFGRSGTLRDFADQRRAYLLKHPEIVKLTP